jgi:hypothetical protein
MDVYDYAFFLSTMWIGPFWFGMLVFPDHELTKKAMQGPLFFLGPILIWWAVTIAEPQGLIDLAKDATDPSRCPRRSCCHYGLKTRRSSCVGSHGRR